MTIYVITPTRRASAEAIHLMMTHALGEAGATSLVRHLIHLKVKGTKIDKIPHGKQPAKISNLTIVCRLEPW